MLFSLFPILLPLLLLFFSYLNLTSFHYPYYLCVLITRTSYIRLTFNTAGGDGAPVTEEFSVDAIEGGRTRRKSKKEILIAKDVDIEKVNYFTCRIDCVVYHCQWYVS